MEVYGANLLPVGAVTPTHDNEILNELYANGLGRKAA
jgi:hypothetical protein